MGAELASLVSTESYFYPLSLICWERNFINFIHALAIDAYPPQAYRDPENKEAYFSNWRNTPLEAEDILHTSLPMSPPLQTK